MHAAADVCVYCAESTNDGKKDVLTCYGLCGKSFHVLCLATENSNYKPSLVNNYLKKIDNLHWYCHTCTTFSAKGIAAALIESVKLLCDIKTTLQPQLDQIKNLNAANPAKKSIDSQTTPESFLTIELSSSLSTDSNLGAASSAVIVENPPSISNHNQTQQQFNDGIPDKSSISTMDVDASASNSPNATQPLNKRIFQTIKRRLPCSPSNHTVQPNKQRKTGKSNDWKVSKSAPTIEKNAPTKNIVKNSPDLNQNVAGKFVRAPKSSLDEIKRVYVTPFLPDVTPADIMAHLNSQKPLRDIMDKIECVKLIKKDAAMDNFTFVSFAISVPKRYITFLTHASVWPKGISAEEFVDKPRKLSVPKRSIHSLVATHPTRNQNLPSHQPPKQQKTGPKQVPSHQAPKNQKPCPKQVQKRSHSNPFAQTQYMMPHPFQFPLATNPMQMMSPWPQMFGLQHQPFMAAN